MAVRCKKCGGTIPDVVGWGLDRNDCKNHTKTKPDIDFGDKFKG